MSLKRAVDLLLNRKDKPKGKTRALAVPPQKQEAAQALRYLDFFGYFQQALASFKDVSLADVVKAIKQFQSMFGLPGSGHLTPQTLRAMEQPRCGCPDIVRPDSEQLRVRAWARAMLPAWRKRGLTFAVQNYLPGLGKADQDRIFNQAYQAWCQHGQIDVQQVAAGQADIVISVGRGAQDNFDGPSGTLAWAYLPNGADQQLQMKFDLDETWVLTPQQRGILVLNVACHEFGHTLGLDHSRVQGALMAPYYNASIAVPQQNDDIPRFQARYGVRTTPTTPSTPPASPAPRVEITGNATVVVNGRQV